MKQIFYFILILLFISCDIINPEEQIPSYLKINKMNLNPPSYFSSNSNNISDVWVYVNSNLIGGFELPCEIPILSEGPTDILITPGIFKDGIKSHHHFYPYYKSVDTIFNFVPEQTIEITPQIYYNENYNVVLNEDFEGIDIQFEQGSNSAIGLDVTTNITIDGEKTGYLLSTDANQTMELVSKDVFYVLTRTLPSYLEIDYISNVEFKVGVIASNSQKNFELVLRPNTSRKKIYVDISDEVGVFNSTTNFKIYFEATSTKAGEFFALDNIRLLTPN